MNHDTISRQTDRGSDFPDAGLAEDLGRCLAPAEDAYCLPPACYRDDEVMAAEIGRLFRGGWIAVGRADRFKSPGDYATFEIAGVPLIVLRDKAGRLQAFANTCRHRGSRLLDGEGTCRRISSNTTSCGNTKKRPP